MGKICGHGCGIADGSGDAGVADYSLYKYVIKHTNGAEDFLRSLFFDPFLALQAV